MTLLAFIVAIVILVLFHELGHYLAARWCNVKVLRFSLGFGKPIYIKQFAGGETEWVVSAIPLGGYVKMLDEREEPVAPNELARAFNRKPVLQRIVIVAAGPIANLLLAIALYWVLFINGVPGIKPVLGKVPEQTPAAVAGLHSRDSIVSINGQATPSWQEIRWILLELALQNLPAHIELRDESGTASFHTLSTDMLVPSDLDGDFLIKLGLQAYQPDIQPVIDKITDGGAAQKSGLHSQDRIVSVNDQPIKRWDDFVEIIRSHPQVELNITVERSNAITMLKIRPDAITESGKQIGRIGAAPQIDRKAFDAMMTEVHYAPWQALVEAQRKTWETSALSLKMMWKMLEGQVSIKNLSGPITIADYAGQSAQIGLGAYLSFLALISISLGILNLLPIPLLDGGHLLYYTVELIKGSPVSETVWEIGQKIGIALLVTMMAFAMYNDISRLILG